VKYILVMSERAVAMSRPCLSRLIAVSLWVISSSVLLGDPPAERPAEKLRSADLESIIPRWNLRDRWTVETVTKCVQRRGPLKSKGLVTPIQWRFAVSKFEKSTGFDCFRIEVDCLLHEDGHPKTVLWFDRQSLRLCKMASEMPTRQGYRVISVSYARDGDQPSPVLCSMSPFPLGAPRFLSPQAKVFESFRYQAVFEAEQKTLDALPFTHEIKQSVRSIEQAEARRVFAEHFDPSPDRDAFAKSLTSGPLTEVRLTSAGRDMRQIWRPSLPWPIYCDNAYTACRLVSRQLPSQPGAGGENPR
jgi:hypothetical protein